MKKRFVIKKYQEYQIILKERNYKKSYSFNVYYQKNEFDYTRVGILVSKKNGNAVIRNKIKRQVRMIFDKYMSYKDNLNIIIGISKNYKIENFENNELELKKILDSIKGETNE